MDDHVLLTGANGYLGSYVCRELLRRGHKVLGLTFPHFRSVIFSHPNVLYHECDIRKDLAGDEGLRALLTDKKVRVIINVAGLLGNANYDENYRTNAQGVQNLIELARTMGIRRFIHMSTVCVLKEIKGPYGETKLKGQESVVGSGLDYTVFIPAMIMGRESLGLNRIMKNVFRIPFVVPLIGDGKQTQHPVFVEDLAWCLVQAIDQRRCFGKVYEIGGDRILAFREMVKMILKAKGERKLLVPVPVFVGKALGWLFSKTQEVPAFTAEHVNGLMQDSRLKTEPLQEDLGFQPTRFEDALQLCVDAIRDDWDEYLKAREEEVVALSEEAPRRDPGQEPMRVGAAPQSDMRANRR